MEGAPVTLATVLRKHGQLPYVWNPVHQFDAYESHRWVADHKDEHRPAEVVLGFVVGEGTDSYGVEQLVGFQLNSA